MYEENGKPHNTEADVGSHRAYLATFDPVNAAGVRWPDFKLKVRA